MRASGTWATASSVIGRTLIETAIRGVRIGSVNLQLRGAWMTFQGHGGMNAPSIFITGALGMQGNATLRLLDSLDQLKKRIVVLIERVSPILFSGIEGEGGSKRANRTRNQHRLTTNRRRVVVAFDSHIRL
jgi:hypothetical protein